MKTAESIRRDLGALNTELDGVFQSHIEATEAEGHSALTLAPLFEAFYTQLASLEQTARRIRARAAKASNGDLIVEAHKTLDTIDWMRRDTVEDALEKEPIEPDRLWVKLSNELDDIYRDISTWVDQAIDVFKQSDNPELSRDTNAKFERLAEEAKELATRLVAVERRAAACNDPISIIERAEDLLEELEGLCTGSTDQCFGEAA